MLLYVTIVFIHGLKNLNLGFFYRKTLEYSGSVICDKHPHNMQKTMENSVICDVTGALLRG
jgi:hypothetical protein